VEDEEEEEEEVEDEEEEVEEEVEGELHMLSLSTSCGRTALSSNNPFTPAPSRVMLDAR
jgi:hypothetical protein